MSFVLKGQNSTVLNEYSIVGFAQGTSYMIKYYAGNPISKLSIDSILEVIDKSMSIYRTDSDISRFNKSETHKIKMDDHLKSVIDESFNTYNTTDGYFDITIKPLIDLWGFGNKEFNDIPTAEEISQAKALVGMKNLSIKGDYLIKSKNGITIDVNGIAQGYTLDVISDYFLSQKIENFIIELGGEIIAKGSKPNGDFIIQIVRPNDSEQEAIYTIKVKDKAVTTSGNYERQRVVNNKLISHHIDPRTGFPVENQVISVTVVADTAMKADAIDNYLMYLKPNEIIQYVDKQKDLDVYIVYSENNVIKELASSGFNNYIYSNQPSNQIK